MIPPLLQNAFGSVIIKKLKKGRGESAPKDEKDGRI